MDENKKPSWTSDRLALFGCAAVGFALLLPVGVAIVMFLEWFGIAF